MSVRLNDLRRFYLLLDNLEQRLGQKRKLSDCSGRMSWPPRGAYFFFCEGEGRSDSGAGVRVVRVGTHALTQRSRTTLWNRLSQHRGVARSGGGNHRGSIFRLLVGTALINRDPSLGVSSWGQGSSAPREIRDQESKLEALVSDVIGRMPFLWLAVGDAPGPESLRGYVERNTIALLSNYDKESLDSPSACWLGHHCSRERVRASGLWNNNHVDEVYDPAFLDVFERLVDTPP